MEKDTKHFRTINGITTEITETNTKVTYITECTFYIGRLELSYQRVLVRRTCKARLAYFLYNNALARAKRAVAARLASDFHIAGMTIRVL
jgi:hypothetical protein